MFWNGYRWAKLHIGMQCLMDGQNLKLVGLHTHSIPTEHTYTKARLAKEPRSLWHIALPRLTQLNGIKKSADGHGQRVQLTHHMGLPAH